MPRLSGAKTVNNAGLAIAGVFGAALGSMLQDTLAERLATSTLFLLAVLLVTNIVMIVVQLKTLNAVDLAREGRRFSIDYHPGMTDHELLELHRKAARLVREAPNDAEIFAVNSYVEVFTNGVTSTEVQEAQRDYLREFELKFDTISYHRLIQLKNGNEAQVRDRPLSQQISPAYLDHYRTIVDYAQENPRRPVRIEEVDAKLPISFVLIKKGNGGQIIWQMSQHAPSREQPDALTINGVFLVTDPDGLLVRHFLQWFHLLDRGRATPLAGNDLRRVE